MCARIAHEWAVATMNRALLDVKVGDRGRALTAGVVADPIRMLLSFPLCRCSSGKYQQLRNL